MCQDEFVISGTSATDGSKACAEDAPTKKWYLIGKPSGGGFGGPSDELLVEPCMLSNVGGCVFFHTPAMKISSSPQVAVAPCQFLLSH